jgi:hypothetical protein
VLSASKVNSHAVFGFDPNRRSERMVSSGPLPIDLSVFEAMRNTDDALRLVGPVVDAREWTRDWEARSVTPPGGLVSEFPRERAGALYGLIVGTARLTKGDYGVGFPDGRSHLEVFELSGAQGESLLFVALATGELSNDHLGYYELLYDTSTEPPRLIDRRHWRFDVAGIEGLEFAGAALGLSVLFLACAMPAALVVLTYTTFSKGSKIRRGCCPKCGFDLLHQFDSGCTECGWAKGEAANSAKDVRRYLLVGRLRTALGHPPRWRTLGLLLTATLLIWYGRSMPGGSPRATGLGSLLLWLGAVLMLLKVAGLSGRPRWLARARGSPLATGFGVALLLSLQRSWVSACRCRCVGGLRPAAPRWNDWPPTPA